MRIVCVGVGDLHLTDQGAGGVLGDCVDRRGQADVVDQRAVAVILRGRFAQLKPVLSTSDHLDRDALPFGALRVDLGDKRVIPVDLDRIGAPCDTLAQIHRQIVELACFGLDALADAIDAAAGIKLDMLLAFGGLGSAKPVPDLDTLIDIPAAFVVGGK